jgi:hypothetical protein
LITSESTACGSQTRRSPSEDSTHGSGLHRRIDRVVADAKRDERDEKTGKTRRGWEGLRRAVVVRERRSVESSPSNSTYFNSNSKESELSKRS